jgi:hypothetical protein
LVVGMCVGAKGGVPAEPAKAARDHYKPQSQSHEAPNPNPNPKPNPNPPPPPKQVPKASKKPKAQSSLAENQKTKKPKSES